MRSFFIDSAIPKYKIIIGSIFGCVLLLGFILGVSLGSSTVDLPDSSAYDCPNNSHMWSANCKGVELRYSANDFAVSSTTSPMNRFIALNIKPYTRLSVLDDVDFTASLLVYAKRKFDLNYELIAVSDKENYHVSCESGAGVPCDSIRVYLNTELTYNEYKFEFSTDNTSAENFPLGDFVFTISLGNSTVNTTELVFSVIFDILSIACLVLLYFYTRQKKDELPTFYLSLMIFLAALICFNNPFLGFKYIPSAAPFFQTLDGICKTFFMAALLAFWMYFFPIVVTEDFTSREFAVQYSKIILIAQIAVVFFFFVFGVVITVMVNIRLVVNPFFVSSSTPAVTVFFVFCAILFFVVIAYLVFIVVKERNAWLNSPVVRMRCIFFAIPTLLILLGHIICIFCGSFLGIGKNTFQSFIFMFLYNIYGWWLVIGFAPSPDGMFTKNDGGESNSETTSIVKPHPHTQTSDEEL